MERPVFSPAISNKNENFHFFGNFNGIIAFKGWKILPRLSDSKFSFSYSRWHFGFKSLLVGLCFSKSTSRAKFFKNANFSPRVISRIHDYETGVANFITLPVWRGGAPVSQLVSQVHNWSRRSSGINRKCKRRWESSKTRSPRINACEWRRIQKKTLVDPKHCANQIRQTRRDDYKSKAIQLADSANVPDMPQNQGDSCLWDVILEKRALILSKRLENALRRIFFERFSVLKVGKNIFGGNFSTFLKLWMQFFAPFSRCNR